MNLDRHTTELEDAGDTWLSFCALSLLATAVFTAVFWQHMFFYWALAAAVPLAMIFGWAISLIRPVRKFVSGTAQFLIDAITIFN